MPKASFSTRALNKDITLSFGLVNIPVNIFTGTVSDAGITRHQYLPKPVMDAKLDAAGQPEIDQFGEPVLVQQTKTVTDDDGSTREVPVFEDHPVGRGDTDKVTTELLTPDERAAVVKKIETEYGPVYVEDSEIESLFSLEPDTLRIKHFQPQHLFTSGRNYVPKSLTFIEPVQTGSGAKKGYNQATLKLFGTLLKAMREENVIAVAELTTRGVPKPVILTADGALWQVWHTDSLREQRELPEVDLVDAEVNMMGSLIQTLLSTSPVDLSDTRSELIQNFANEKAEAGDFDKVSDTYVASPKVDTSSDLLAMLQASIDQAKAS